MTLTSEELIVIIDPQKDFTDIDGNYAKNHPIHQIKEVKTQLNRLTKQFAKDKFVIIFRIIRKINSEKEFRCVSKAQKVMKLT